MRRDKGYQFALIIILVMLLSLVSLSSTVSGQEDVGVGVRAVRPRITEVHLEHNYDTHHLYINVFDLNSWRHVKEVSVEFYRGSDLIRHYIFNQTEDLERRIDVIKGDGLVAYEVTSSDLRETVDQRCTLSLHFQFKGINYDKLIIRAVDHAGGTSESVINFHGITTGRTFTPYILLGSMGATAVIIYKTAKDVGGEIG